MATMADISKNVLADELKYFEEKKKDWLKTYKGQFVLIEDKKLIGAFSTQGEAYKKGVEKFSNEPFLIKEIAEEEQIASVPALTIGLINASL